MSDCYYFKDDKTVGPMPWSALQTLLDQGDIDGQTLVWSADHPDWRPAAEALPQTPPPLPQAAPKPLVPHSPAAAPIAEPAAAADPRWHTEPVHPWRRYLARIIDVYSVGTLAYVVFAIPFYLASTDVRATEALLTNQIFASVAVTALMVPVLALFVGLTGTSPGKWAAGVRVLTPAGRPLGLRKGFKRELSVYLFGMGLGIPLISLITLIGSYNKLKNDKRMDWDVAAGAVVSYGRDSVWQVIRLTLGVLAGGCVVALLTAAGQH